MGIYVFNVDAFVTALTRDSQNESSHHDIGKDILPELVRTSRVYAFTFMDKKTGEASYWRDVGTLDSYYEACMERLYTAPVMIALRLRDPLSPLRLNKRAI